MIRYNFFQLSLASLSDSADFYYSRNDNALCDYLLSLKVVVNTFGFDFVKRHFLVERRQETFSEKLIIRLFSLSDALWKLKDVEGFSQFIERNRCNDIESIFYELWCASKIKEICDRVILVAPEGKKTKDFDIKAYGLANYDYLNIEVKARKVTFTNQKQIKDFLSKCRSQLAKDENGAVLIKTVLDPLVFPQRQMDFAIKNYLRSTERIKFVSYLWDQSADPDSSAIGSCTIDRGGQIQAFLPMAEKFLIPSFLIDLNSYRHKLGKKLISLDGFSMPDTTGLHFISVDNLR